MSQEYVVRFGNHWLMTDPMLTKIEWVSDLAMASTHSRVWAEKFRTDLKKERKDVEVFEWADALKNMRDLRDSKLASAYYNTVYNYFQEHHPELNNKIPGVNNPGWVFGYEARMTIGVPALDYVKEWLKIKKIGKKKEEALIQEVP